MSWLISKAMMDNYGNLHSSQEQEAGFSEENYSDGEPSVQSSGNPTQLVFSSADRTKAFSRRSLSGMTCKLLTASRGEDVLTSFLEAFPVKTSHVLAREQASKETDHPCGNTWRESLEKFDLDTHTWKTHQCLWDEDLQPSSVTCAKWGMMQNGVLWERTTLPRLTSVTGSGSWATPTTMDTLPPKSEKALLREAIEVRPGRSKPGNLRDQVSNMKNWLTPTCQEVEHLDAELTKTGRRLSKDGQSSHSLNLADSVKQWPTPAARDYKGANSKEHCEVNGTGRKHMDQLPNAVAHGDKPEPSGQLSPDWVEWLMGWPIGWTSMDNAQEVVCASDCACECGDDDCTGECGCTLICQRCGGDYSVCRDIGPTEDDVHYEDRDGILYGTRTELDWRDWKTDPADADEIPRVATGIKCRADRLKAIGNGQVPQVAAMAWNILNQDEL